MAYLAPKTDWTSVDGVLSTDLNRIEGNIETLATLRAYPTATGTGTAIVVTTGYFELVAGRSLTFIASANNSGAATTLNADGTGAKNLYKPNTTDAPTIISGKAYTVWYNGTSFFVKASAEGNAVAGDVIKDKTFSNDEDTGITGTLELTGNAAVGDVLATKTFYNTDPKTKRTGTMTNNGTVSTDISAKATEVTIAQGYHSGSGKVKISATEQAKIITGNIKAGITLLGVAGKSSVVDTADANAVAGDILSGKTGYVNGSKITGNIASKGAATYTPGTTDQTITAGQYLSGAQTIAGDADLVAGNIKTGVGIFGVTGTFGDGVAGNTVIADASTPRYFDSTAYKKYKEITVSRKVTYRVVMELGSPSFPCSCYGRIYKNGSAYGTERFLNNDTVTLISEDLVFSAGDKVQFYGKCDTGEQGCVGAFSVRITPTPSPTATVDLD